MATVGRLAFDDKANAIGKFRTRTMSMEIALHPKFDGKKLPINEDKPSHVVMAKDLDGQPFELGVAYAKVSEDPNKKGDVFYGLSLDDPSFDFPLYLTAFETGQKPGEYDLVWRRSRKQAA